MIIFFCPRDKRTRTLSSRRTALRAWLRTARAKSRAAGLARSKAHAFGARIAKAQTDNSFSNSCASPTWWSWRGGCTRSHSELGRETPQRRWYFVSRRGRVGRCQVCQAHETNLLITNMPHTAARQCKRRAARAAFAVPDLTVRTLGDAGPDVDCCAIN